MHTSNIPLHIFFLNGLRSLEIKLTVFGPVYIWSLNAFFLIGKLSYREKTRCKFPQKRIWDRFKSDHSNDFRRRCEI